MSKMHIPLVAVLWEHPKFQGRKRTFVMDDPDLSQSYFTDLASAVAIHPGPNYYQFLNGVRIDVGGGVQYLYYPGATPPTVSLFEHPGFQGWELVLPMGQWPDLQHLAGRNFNDQISSVRFNVALGKQRDPGLYQAGGFTPIEFDPLSLSAAQIAPIPVVLGLHCLRDAKVAGSLTFDPGAHAIFQLIESSSNLAADFGAELDDAIARVQAYAGPDNTGKEVARLYRDRDFKGGSVSVKPPTFRNLSDDNFENVCSSIQFADCDC